MEKGRCCGLFFEQHADHSGLMFCSLITLP